MSLCLFWFSPFDNVYRKMLAFIGVSRRLSFYICACLFVYLGSKEFIWVLAVLLSWISSNVNYRQPGQHYKWHLSFFVCPSVAQQWITTIKRICKPTKQSACLNLVHVANKSEPRSLCAYDQDDESKPDIVCMCLVSQGKWLLEINFTCHRIPQS